MVKQEVVGKDLVFEFILTNIGKKDKRLNPDNFGRSTVRNIEGEALDAIMDSPETLAASESAKLRLTIKNGASEIYKIIRSKFGMSEPDMSYDSEIIIKPRR